MSALSISPLCSIDDIEVIPCADDLKSSGLPTPNVTWASPSLVVSSKRKASLRVCVARLNSFIARSKATDHPALAAWLAQTTSLPGVRTDSGHFVAIVGFHELSQFSNLTSSRCSISFSTPLISLNWLQRVRSQF